MSDDAERVVASFRLHGRVSRLVPLEPLRLPRSPRVRRQLERAAEDDHHVKRALDAAYRAEHERPGVIHRYLSAGDSDVYVH
jgi:hypothetical protein